MIQQERAAEACIPSLCLKQNNDDACFIEFIIISLIRYPLPMAVDDNSISTACFDSDSMFSSHYFSSLVSTNRLQHITT